MGKTPAPGAAPCILPPPPRERGVSHRGHFLAALILAAAIAAPAAAADGPVTLETRPGVTLTSYFMPRAGASAVLLLLTGGSGSIGLRDGVPTSLNFLVRSRDHFAAAGFSVFILGRPSDRADLDPAYRIGADHLEDLRRVVAHLRHQTGLPVWLVGTSRGTISATAAAIALGDELAGIVLTSSVTAYRIPGAVPTQNLGAVRLPVLVLHHERDACRACSPHELGWIMDGLSRAPVKRRLVVSGGEGPSGDACEALHWHGYIGMEAEAVRLITDWIKAPAGPP